MNSTDASNQILLPEPHPGNLVSSIHYTDYNSLSALYVVMDKEQFVALTGQIPPPNTVCVFPYSAFSPPTWNGNAIRGYSAGSIQPLALPISETVLIAHDSVRCMRVQHAFTDKNLLEKNILMFQNEKFPSEIEPETPDNAPENTEISQNDVAIS